MKTFDATITATITMKVDAETKEEAIGKIKRTIPTRGVHSKSGRTLYTIIVEDVHLTEIRIMDGSTSHNPKLVELINMCYVERRDALYEIVKLLSSRDIDEFEDFNTNTASTYDLTYRYLEAIADDQDLITIINYCRM